MEGWVPTKDLSVAAGLCVERNSGRRYEICWEYANLDGQVLRQRRAKAWLYYEGNKLKGVVLGRRRERSSLHGAFVFEEAWAPVGSLSGELDHVSLKNKERVMQFKQLLESGGLPKRLVLRAALDNQFAHMIARELKGTWIVD